MADLQKTISIIFGSKNEVSKVIDSIGRDIDKMAAPLANAAYGVAKLDAALAALAVGGIVYAFKKAVEFENSVVSLRKVVGDSPKEMAAAQDAALKMSGVYGESATKILESTANFVQAGFSVQESIKLTKNAMDLKIAGDVSAAQSSEYLISILKGFKAPAEDAGRVIDILNEVSNKYATDVQQLAIGMADLSPIAKIMGFSFEETAGLLTPVIEVFGSGSESARALRTGLLKLIDDTAPVGDALKTLGVAQTDVNGQLRSGKDILLDVSRAFQTLSEPQKLFITQQLTGIDQSAKMVEVFNGLSKSIEVTAVAMKSAGSAQAEVDARLASSEVQINRLGVEFENLARIIGDKFKTSITGAISGGVELETALREIATSGMFDPLLGKVDEFANAIGESLRAAAENLPEAFAMVDWSSLLNSIDKIGEGIGKLFDIDTTDPEELAGVIQTVVDSLSSLMDVSRGIGEVFTPIIHTAVGIVDGFNTLDESTKTLVGNLLGAAAAYSMFGPVAGTVMFMLGQDAETMATVVNTSFAVVENGINAVRVAILSLAMIFSTAAQGMAEAIAAGWAIFGYDATEDLKRTGDRVKIIGGMLEEANSRLVLSSDKVAAAFSGTGDKAKTAQSKTEEYSKALEDIPKDVKTELKVNDGESRTKISDIQSKLDALPDTKKIGVEVLADGTTIETTKSMIYKTFPDGQVLITNIGTQAHQENLDATKKKIDDAIPASKFMEIQAQIDVAKIKEQSEIIQRSIEWKAKIDIAQIEAAAVIMKATFASIDNTVTSTGNTISSMLGSYASSVSAGKGGTSFIEQQIRDESKRRDDALALQTKLVNAQVDQTVEQTKRLKAGDSLITIDGKGLQPHLEAFMFEILSAIQIKANAEGMKFLVGTVGT